MLGSNDEPDAVTDCKESALLSLRLANIEDTQDILRWRNDPLTRAMSRNNDIIEDTQHRIWFNQALQDSKRLFLVGMYAEKKIGMVRFDQQQLKRWEINICLAPEARGKGMGKLILKSALLHFLSQYPEASIIADIKKINLASLRLFESMGFVNNAIVDDITMQYIFARHRKLSSN